MKNLIVQNKEKPFLNVQITSEDYLLLNDHIDKYTNPCNTFFTKGHVIIYLYYNFILFMIRLIDPGYSNIPRAYKRIRLLLSPISYLCIKTNFKDIFILTYPV